MIMGFGESSRAVKALKHAAINSSRPKLKVASDETCCYSLAPIGPRGLSIIGR